MSNNIGSVPAPNRGKPPTTPISEDSSVDKMLKKHGITSIIHQMCYVFTMHAMQANEKKASETQKKINAKIKKNIG